MLKVTRWSPDTCGCVLEYEWDDAQDENTRTHKFKKAVQLCEHHKALIHGRAHDQVLSENTSKNKVWGKAREIKPDLELGDFTWSFDKDRKLKVGFLGNLTVTQKKQLKDFADAEFGSDKVEVI